MSKKRYIDTKFRSDNFVVEKLTPLDRYLFLYLFTNERTNICGIYELPISVICFETWIEKKDLLKMFWKLKPKVFYIDWWVYIKNFQKHQNLDNKFIKKWVEVGLQSIPKEIMTRIWLLSSPEESSGIPSNYNYDYDFDSDSDIDSDIKKLSKDNWEIKKISPEEKIDKSNPEINKILEIIKSYNNWVIDWTWKELRIWWNNLLNKLKKVKSVEDGKYTWDSILIMILEIISKNDYYSAKIAGPKKLYNSLAELMNVCSQEVRKQNKWEVKRF